MIRPRTLHAGAGWAAAAWLMCLASARATVVEEVVGVPVSVPRASATPIAQNLVVLIVRAPGAARRPYLILHHGRAPDAAGRRALGMANYPANARYFAALGFIVLIPTRIGYGVSHGPDLEYTGPCEAKRFADGLAPALLETRALIDYAAALPYVDAHHGLVVGESFGGLIAVAAASAALPGLTGAVNVSGGDGGDSLHHVDAPCGPELLRRTFAALGHDARVPTLWMYSRNDRYWGPRLPRDWFDAYVAAGARAQFVALPADRNNGHFIFTRNAPAWQPAFEAFVAGLDLGTCGRAARSAVQ